MARAAPRGPSPRSTIRRSAACSAPTRPRAAGRAGVPAASLDDPSIGDMLGAEAHERLVHDIAMLDEAGHPFSHEAMPARALSQGVFASAPAHFAAGRL